MSQNIVIKVTSKFFTPFIVMFGLYIQLHGDYSPGGGFQAGIICASAFILYGLLASIDKLLTIISLNFIKILCCIGPLMYSLVGVVTIFLQKEFLNYYALDLANPKAAQHIGILIIELGVGITVFSVAMVIFIVFAKRYN